MVMSNDIDCKEAAEEDAKKRCKIIPSIAKVVYYDVSGGRFKVLYSYTTPNVKEPSKQRRYGGGGGSAPVQKAQKEKAEDIYGKTKKEFRTIVLFYDDDA